MNLFQISSKTQSLEEATAQAEHRGRELEEAAEVRRALEGRVEELTASLAHSEIRIRELETASSALGEAAEDERSTMDAELDKTGHQLQAQVKKWWK